MWNNIYHIIQGIVLKVDFFLYICIKNCQCKVRVWEVFGKKIEEISDKKWSNVT